MHFSLLGCPIHEPTFAPHLYFERPEHSEFLVTSLCALSAPYSDHPVVVSYWQSNDLPRYLAGEPFFFKGQAMVPHMIDSPSLEVVAGLLYLSSAAAAMGKSSSQGAPLKFPLMQMAVNLALQLRLNIDPDVEEVHGQLTWIQREVRRRFWWTLFCMETINSTPSHEPPPSIDKFNQPLPCRGPYLHGSSPTVRSPAPDALFYSVLTSDSLPRLSAFTPGIDLDVMDCMSRLTRIFHAIKQLSGTVWEMAQKLARRVSSEDVERIHALKDASYHARIQQLETELEEWLELLPEWARNIDQYPVIPELSSSARPPLWQLFSLHLFHHACYVALHLPTLIAFPITSPLPPDALSIQSTIDAAYRICYHHTQHVAFLLERLRRVTYTSDHIHPWESFYLLYTGLVLIRQSTKPSDIRHQSTIQHNVDNHIWLMEQVGQRWYSTKRIQELLSEVIVAQEYSCLTVDI
ncbi:hypothetical protein BC832DRAFT_139754 [Gaertneriomyces semiglobifer]|nr:hypothetical protein BC832DRAFT_139754 [Gaertneriomyces semiglobifer]